MRVKQLLALLPFSNVHLVVSRPACYFAIIIVAIRVVEAHRRVRSGMVVTINRFYQVAYALCALVVGQVACPLASI